MSIPSGAKQITNIEYLKLRFLSDINDELSTVSPNDFNMTSGKPLKNLTTVSTIDTFFLNTLNSSLNENLNVHQRFIFDFPLVLEIDYARDLYITGETSIDAVFVHEGASMKNMFGYYFYIIDGNGNKILLDNDDNNTDNSNGYFKPTIIFPHVYSESGDSDTLQVGDTRRLKGNLANGNFESVNIGFFLMPHGWLAKTGNDLYADVTTLYSTIDFCTQYKNQDYQMVNDKIYSVFAKAKNENNDELLFVGFEDIFYNQIYNLDYNDCVVGFIASNINNISNYNQFAEIVNLTPTEKNNIVYIDNEGEYVEFKQIYAIDDTKDYIFERIQHFETSTDRDQYYDAVINILTNYNISIEKEDSLKIRSVYLFRKNDIKNSDKGNGKKKIYITEIKYTNVNIDAATLFKDLVAKNINNTNYSETYLLYEQNNPSTIIISEGNVIDKPSFNSGDFRIIGNGVMDCKQGKSHLPFKDTKIYKVYKNINTSNNKGLVINIKMDDHPDGYQLGNKKFVGWVSFNVDGVELLTVNLNTLDLYDSNLNIDNNQTFNNISYTGIQQNSAEIKNLINVFRNDSGATYRIVYINGYLPFYCIRLPNIKNNPTMVYLDTNFYLGWDDKFNLLDGTYYNKRQFLEVNNFSDY